MVHPSFLWPRWRWPALLGVLMLALVSPALAEEGAPTTSVRDAAFERFVDLDSLATAWEEKNAELLTDLALQLAEGERVLLRPHKAISADQVFAVAVKIAAERKDTATLARLSKALEAAKKADLAAEVAQAQKLASVSRAYDPALIVQIDQVAPAVYLVLQSCLEEISQAKLDGDADSLDEIAARIPEMKQLTEAQRQSLLKEAKRAKESLPSGADEDPAIEALNKLTAESRAAHHAGGGGHAPAHHPGPAHHAGGAAHHPGPAPHPGGVAHHPGPAHHPGGAAHHPGLVPHPGGATHHPGIAPHPGVPAHHPGIAPLPGVAIHPGIAAHPGVAVHPGIAIHPGVQVHPGAVVHPGVVVHERVVAQQKPLPVLAGYKTAKGGVSVSGGSGGGSNYGYTFGSVNYTSSVNGFVIGGSQQVLFTPNFSFDPGDTIIGVGGVLCANTRMSLQDLIALAYQNGKPVMVVRDGKTRELVVVNLPALGDDTNNGNNQ